jgi:hypothetical protein
MRYFSVIIIAIFLFFPSDTIAEVKEIIAEGTYNMGDGETPSVAESWAISDFQKACDLEDEDGCEFLHVVGCI